MFVAMNRITCDAAYADRFEELFRTRAREVDKLPGFHWVKILRPKQPGKPYIVMSYWDREEDFQAWRKTEAFQLGHRRGFQDITDAKREGREAPMSSDMELYDVFAE